MLENTTRQAAVAGRFYPSDKKAVEEIIEKIIVQEKSRIDYQQAKEEIYGAVVPHAGYVFSAYQAVHFFALLEKLEEQPQTFVIINPNHTGYGEAISLDNHQFWQTPFGEIEQDDEFISKLDLPFSNIAHNNEHSGEVMLPLLQYFQNKPFKIVMICLTQQTANNAKLLAEKIYDAVKQTRRKIMLIASSDFTHFEDAQSGAKMDDLVLAEIENQNIEALEKTVQKNQISVCGYGPIMCLMEYARLNGAYKTNIIARGHSGEVSPSDKVVDYISILFSKTK